MTNTPQNSDHSEADDEKWDDRELGADAEHAHRVSPGRERQLHAMIDDALDLEMISIRLQAGLIDAYKELAKREGIGYQPLMRQILTRYIRDHSDA